LLNGLVLRSPFLVNYLGLGALPAVVVVCLWAGTWAAAGRRTWRDRLGAGLVAGASAALVAGALDVGKLAARRGSLVRVRGLFGDERDGMDADASVPDGPRVGMGSFDLSDPAATFRPIEPVRPAPRLRPVRALLRPLRFLAVWFANLVALAAAGLIVTSVGPGDPVAYVMWAAAFALVNASLGPAVRLWRSPFAPIASATAVPLVLNIVLVWLMTVIAPPFHAPDLASISKAATVMWLVNLPLRLLIRRPSRPAPPAGSP
jgi:hypothetical protein